MREAKFGNFEVVKNQPGRWLGGAILFVLVAPQVYALTRQAIDHSYRAGQLLIGLYFLFVGFIFLFSYYIPERSFVFRGFLWFCERASAPGSRKMAFFYFGLCMFIGIAALFHQ
ncbi:MAG: hypothetical protein JSS26_19345 [Nitrospira sp.]|nr:hypothetical protein [Nitrospira sp.]